MSYQPRIDYRIRQRRLDLGLTQRQLAALAELRAGQPMVSLVELGHAERWAVRAVLRGLCAYLLARQSLIARQNRERRLRALFEREATPVLRAAMLQRAGELIFEEANPEAADGLLEFLPAADVDSLLDEFCPL